MIGCLLDSFSYFIINKLPITFLLFFPFSCNSLTDTAQLHHIGNCLSRAHRVEYFPSITLLINKRIDDSSLSWTTLEGLLLLMLGWEFLALLIVIINVNIWDLWGTALCVSGSRWYIHHIRTLLSCFWPTRYSNIYMEGMFLLLLPRTSIIAFWIWYFLPAHFSMVLILICHACLFSSPYSWHCNLFSHIESVFKLASDFLIEIYSIILWALSYFHSPNLQVKLIGYVLVVWATLFFRSMLVELLAYTNRHIAIRSTRNIYIHNLIIVSGTRRVLFFI